MPLLQNDGQQEASISFSNDEGLSKRQNLTASDSIQVENANSLDVIEKSPVRRAIEDLFNMPLWDTLAQGIFSKCVPIGIKLVRDFLSTNELATDSKILFEVYAITSDRLGSDKKMRNPIVHQMYLKLYEELPVPKFSLPVKNENEFNVFSNEKNIVDTINDAKKKAEVDALEEPKKTAIRCAIEDLFNMPSWNTLAQGIFSKCVPTGIKVTRDFLSKNKLATDSEILDKICKIIVNRLELVRLQGNNTRREPIVRQMYLMYLKLARELLSLQQADNKEENPILMNIYLECLNGLQMKAPGDKETSNRLVNQMRLKLAEQKTAPKCSLIVENEPIALSNEKTIVDKINGVKKKAEDDILKEKQKKLEIKPLQHEKPPTSLLFKIRKKLSKTIEGEHRFHIARLKNPRGPIGMR